MKQAARFWRETAFFEELRSFYSDVFEIGLAAGFVRAQRYRNNKNMSLMRLIQISK
jgi:hypothetical protein